MDDAELISIAQSFRDEICTNGKADFHCFMVCAPLQGYLSALHGMRVEICETKAVKTDFGTCNHIWLRLNDGRVLDPTADQFNRPGRKRLPPVYLGRPTALHRPTTISQEE